MGLGDELLAAGDARRMMLHDPRRVEIIGRDGLRRWHPLWQDNPRIARVGERGDFQRLVNGPGLRPYHTGKSTEHWSFNRDYRPTPAELTLTAAEQAFGRKHAGRLIVEPHIKKKASPNKQWPWVKWNKLVYLAQEEAGLRLTQIGPAGTALLDGVDFIETPDFRSACAVIANARACVFHEGGLHHAAAAFGTRAVVIFGGFTPIELTGYDMHVNLGATFVVACGMRVPCKHCEEWMGRIAPGEVLKQLKGLL